MTMPTVDQMSSLTPVLFAIAGGLFIVVRVPSSPRRDRGIPILLAYYPLILLLSRHSIPRGERLAWLEEFLVDMTALLVMIVVTKQGERYEHGLSSGPGKSVNAPRPYYWHRGLRQRALSGVFRRSDP